jgi:N-acetylneuraminic acid mutarotase
MNYFTLIRCFICNTALSVMSAIFGMLCMTSISFAQDNIWTSKTDMPTAKFGHATCVVNGKIYVIGGVEDAESTTILAVEEYDPETDTWTTKTDMQTPRYWFGVCAVNGKIYAIGGTRNVNGPGLSTVDEYDPVADTWTTKTDMPTARAILSASVVNGKIYAIGGTYVKGGSTLATVEEYDPATDIWTTKTNMDTARWGHSTCVVNGKIYAIGGTAASVHDWPGLATVEEYDPATDTWTPKTDMPARRAYLSASVVNGKIYAIGGGRDLATSGRSTVEEYDPAADKWTTKTLMPTARFFLSTSAVNDKIYAIGGAVTAWHTSVPWQGCSTVEEYDPSFDQPTSIYETLNQLPQPCTLMQNFPNPFNYVTHIKYQLYKNTGVCIKILNALGQEVETIIDEKKKAGNYTMTWDASNNASGLYFISLQTDENYKIRKMLLIR